MTVIIGVDPHKQSHTAVAICGDEHKVAKVTVRGDLRADDQAPRLGRAVREADMGHRVSRGSGLLAGPAACRCR